MKPEDFFTVIEDKIDPKLAAKMKPMELELTAYLAENVRDRINYAKLGRALALRSMDEPLVQAGTTAITEAQGRVRRALAGTGGDTVDSAETVQKNFLAWCVKYNYTYQKLFD